MGMLDDAYWSERYRHNDIGWDVGYATPPITQYIDRLQNKKLAILIPGCGNAYEAKYLLEKGFTNITVLDISLELVERLRREMEGKPITILHEDFFEHMGHYDLIIEQTFFCALQPELRNAYVIKMASLLKENGTLAGLLFNTTFEDGPPFGGNIEEYRALFAQHLLIEVLEPCGNSIAPRAGTELWLLARRKH